jgi:hypothetical protein
LHIVLNYIGFSKFNFTNSFENSSLFSCNLATCSSCPDYASLLKVMVEIIVGFIYFFLLHFSFTCNLRPSIVCSLRTRNNSATPLSIQDF